MKKVRFKNQWGETYMFLRYKLENPSARMDDIGLMDEDDIRVKILHNQFNSSFTRSAVHQVCLNGLLDCYYIFPGGHLFREENYTSKATLEKLTTGELFNKSTGKPFDVDTVTVRYAMNKFSAIDNPKAYKPTLWERFVSFFRSGT